MGLLNRKENVMDAKKARKLSDTRNKNTKYILHPWFVSQIKSYAERGYRYWKVSDWTEDNKILFENLGFKTEVRYTKKFWGRLESHLVVSW